MIKSSNGLRSGLGRLLLAVATAMVALTAQAAGPFTVNITSDTHATAPSSSANDSGGHISLRSAIEAANAQNGVTATLITVPAGTYNLTLGELDVAPNGHKTNTISGAGPATTIISQTDPTNRVFNLDFNSLGSAITTISGLTIQGGHDGMDKLGGAGILAGSLEATPKDSLSLSNCVVQNNHCTTNTTQETGGGIEMAGGDLLITGCTFSNNSCGQSFGGAIFALSQAVISSLNVTNSIFLNNSVTNNSGNGPEGGGAIMLMTTNGSVNNLVGCTFTNNRVLGNFGLTYGGAIQINGGALNVSGSTLINNSVTGQGGLGGAIYADAGTVNMVFCRLTGNTASTNGGGLYNHGSNGATTTAANDWWGCNSPGTSGCDVVTGDGSGSTLTFAPWLILTNTASPGTINAGQSATLTASVLQNSANQALTPAQVAVLIGLPLTWAAGAHGILGAAQATLQANGHATALFTNDSTCNSGVPTVTLDNATVLAPVLVQCPDLTLSKGNNVDDLGALGGHWIWTLHVANAGAAPAAFTNGATIVLDNLPNAAVAYGTPAVSQISGLSGSLATAIDGSKNLTVTASGAVSLAAGGGFVVQVTATPTDTGTYANPRLNGSCLVDPSNNVPESNKANNSANNTVTVVCPNITATVSGDTNICPGGTAVITVTVTGGTPPYSVTLTNGSTQAGSSPLSFYISPATNTVYQVSSGSDSLGCQLNGSGSATVTVTPLSPPPITLSPASVLANSAGNQASVLTGYPGYAWTISNGSIIGPTNQASVTYAAGGSNNVQLAVSIFNGGACNTSSSATVPVITGFSVHTNVVFSDALSSTNMGMAFDGTNYWSCSGGGTTGARLARYGLTGALLSVYVSGLDFRSIVTRSDGTVLARTAGSGVIYQQTTPGTFAASGVTLAGGTLDAQAAVVLNGAGNEFDAVSAGVVSRWSTNGTYLGTINLSGFGTVPAENLFPQNRRLASMGNFWLTFNGTNILSVWNTNGNRLTRLTLATSATNFDSASSFSYCNGKAFIVDLAGSKWRAHDLFAGAAVAVLSAEATVAWNMDVSNKITGVGPLPRVDFYPVVGADPPPLSQLRGYQAVMLMSDSAFQNPTNVGNVLADYLDQGGGVVVQNFAFITNGSAGFGLQGRLATNGYLPFTSTNYATPATLTMVKDLPAHPLLDGVNSFTGGATSYQNAPMSTNSGALQVAHWSNGQAFAGTKDDGAGRCAGLNFFPPSSDSFPNGGWVSSTDGARLMVNGLLWSGKIPPTILSGPADQILAPGAIATFNVLAAGTSVLGYQWRFNGTNLPAATGSSLSVSVQSATVGAYSVVVSNLYGTTTSLDAALNPQLRFLPLPNGHGAFSLYLADADGSPVATNRAARMSLFTATNLTAPLTLWTLLTNQIVPSGTLLRADGLNTTNSARQFFRTVEAP